MKPIGSNQNNNAVMRLTRLVCIMAVLFISLSSKANNVNITDVKVVNNGGGDVRVSFDLSWENSWRVNTGQNNYDGIWVFFKYRVQGTEDWIHLQLSGNNPAGTGYSIYQAPMPGYMIPPYIGAMVYRSSFGTGSVSFNDIQLGVYPGGLPYNVDIKAFAIEMVYIPGVNQIYAGDGDNTTESVNAFHQSDKDNNFAVGIRINGFPLIGTRTDANTFDDDYVNWDNGKQMYITDSGYSYTNNIAAVNKKWPTGHALWCMKYEISQGGYRDFLNTLTRQQQVNRVEAAITAPRGTLAMATVNAVRTVIKIDTPATATKAAVFGCDANGNNYYNEVYDGEYIACNYLSWADLAAYLAWAGLAPMTEISYERICLGHTDAGINRPVRGGYAWGTSQVATTAYSLTNINNYNEYVSNISPSGTMGNANYAATSPKNIFSTGMPLRDGLFAAYSGSVNRAIAGAAFFGVMEMSGNLSEQCVTIANAQGRLFNPTHGNGYLDPNGFAAYIDYWPGVTASSDSTGMCYGCPVKYSTGTILRGGHYASPASELRVADRSQGQASPIRKPTQGGRGVLYVK